MKVPMHEKTEVDRKAAGNAVRKLRLQNRISAFELANAIKKHPSTMTLLEKGERKWTEQLFKLCVDTINRLAKEGRTV